MVAEAIKREIREELMFAASRRDIQKVFAAAEQDFRNRAVSRDRRAEVLKEIRENLNRYIDPSKDSKNVVLVVEAQSIIDEMLK